MNYYEHHIGDYLRDTAHLSMLEDSAYRRLLDRYYTSEQPLPAEVRECCKLARAQSKPERDAVAAVLREFFQLAEDGWRQKRADEEIARYQDKQRKAKASADARWSHSERNANAYAKASPNAMRTQSEGNATHGRTPARAPARPQTPDTSLASEMQTGEARKRAAPPPERPQSVPEQVWTDWLTLRKAKKAPVTKTVLDGAATEAAKAGLSLEAFLRVWCERGTQGLQADWLKPNERPSQRANGHATEPEWVRERRERTEQFAGPAAAKRPAQTTTIEMEPPDAALRVG